MKKSKTKNIKKKSNRKKVNKKSDGCPLLSKLFPF